MSISQFTLETEIRFFLGEEAVSLTVKQVILEKYDKSTLVVIIPVTINEVCSDNSIKNNKPAVLLFFLAGHVWTLQETHMG